MDNYEKNQLMVKVARLYYEECYSQNEIGSILGLSRPYVSKIINEARQNGIVEIRVIDPYSTEHHIESMVKDAFGLKKVIIVGTKNRDDIFSRIALALSKYLNGIIKNNDVIGVGWGKTLYYCAKQIKITADANNISVVQLCGAISMIEKNIYATEIPENFAKAFDGKPYALPIPAVVDSKQAKKILENDKNISRILEMGRQSNIAIYTAGLFGYESALLRGGYVNEEQAKKLLIDGAVGDVCSRLIDSEGNIIDNDLNERTIGIELEDLKNKEYSICVATGIEKVSCIYGALKSGYPNVLITDEDVAAELIKIKEKDRP